MSSHGKAKGSSYERHICKLLSLWVTNGARTDSFWRSAMSGGRATVAHRKGVEVRQAGDICAVSPEGHALCERYYLELKHYKSLDIESFILRGKGALAGFWHKAVQEARKHKRVPLMIVRQNHTVDLIITLPNALTGAVAQPLKGMIVRVKRPGMEACEIRCLSSLLEQPFAVK